MSLIIERAEPEEEELTCRFCGATQADTFYFDREGEYIGCEYCVRKKYWEDVRPEDIE